MSRWGIGGQGNACEAAEGGDDGVVRELWSRDVTTW